MRSPSAGIRLFSHLILTNSLMTIFMMLIQDQYLLAKPCGDDSLLSHYKLEIGNAWDYTGGSYFLGSFFYPEWKFVTVTHDSIHTNGRKYYVLEQVSYNMEGSNQQGSLGQIRKDIFLQRIDSTSLNVYQVDPFDLSNSTEELLIDSLKADIGDSIFINPDYGWILQLFEVSEIEFWDANAFCVV